MWKKNAFSQTHTITIESSTVVAQSLQPVHATFVGNYSQLNQNESAPGSVAIDCQWTPQDVLNLSFVMLSLWFHSYLKWRVDFFLSLRLFSLAPAGTLKENKMLGKRLKRMAGPKHWNHVQYTFQCFSLALAPSVVPFVPLLADVSSLICAMNKDISKY